MPASISWQHGWDHCSSFSCCFYQLHLKESLNFSICDPPLHFLLSPSLFPFLCGSYIYGGPLWKTDNDEVNSPREQFFFPCHPSTHQGKPRSRVLRHPTCSWVLLLVPFLKQKYCITFIPVMGLLMSEVTSDVILPGAFPGYPQGILLFIHAKAGHRHTKPNWNWVRSSKQTSSIFKVKHWATVNH